MGTICVTMQNVGKPGPDEAQLNVRISADISVELDELCGEYRLTKEGLCQALLAHSLADDQIETALQLAKDAADRRMRARRLKRRESKASPDEPAGNVVRLSGTDSNRQ